MSFFINTKYRSNQVELMDDFSIKGKVLFKTLDQIALINKFLGGNKVTLSALKKVLQGQSRSKEITIIDIGCGGGDMLREISEYGKKKRYRFKLIGMDANEHTINYAKKISADYPEISYLQQDIFSDEFRELSYDIVLSTLFLHHFKEEEILNILSPVIGKAKIAVIVNDLHRHVIAYYLFKLLSLFIRNPMVREDGLISILRGFKKHDLERISTKLNLKSSIQWKWAFRFQWIIQE